MRFMVKKRRQPPAVKLELPSSKTKPRPGATDAGLIVTITKQAPFLYLGKQQINLETLQSELTAAAQRNPEVSLAIRGDTLAPWGQILNVMEAARAANIREVSSYTKEAIEP